MATVPGSHAAFLAAHCSVLSPWRPEQLLHSGPWLGCAGRPARPSACPVRPPILLPAVGAASSTPSRCPQALPGWAQESVFTNTIHMAPGALWLCPEDVRPRAPGGGPGARLSVAQGNQAGRLLPGPASTPSLQAGLQALGSGASQRLSPKCSFPYLAYFTVLFSV